MPEDLKYKVAVITGAAGSRGIGAASARRLADTGISVVLVDLEQNKDELAGRAKEIRESGGEADALVCDITDEDQVRALAEAVIDKHGGIDILFNNAGTGVINYFEKTTLADFDKNYQVNVRGTVAVTQALLPSMKSRGGGSIINNASIGGMYADPYFSAYNSSKFAVVGLTKCLALELAERNIRVNAICPGFVDTDMADRMPNFFAERDSVSLDEARRGCYKVIAMKRPGSVEEVAGLVAFLANAESSYITGAVIPVAGGYPAAL